MRLNLAVLVAAFAIGFVPSTVLARESVEDRLVACDGMPAEGYLACLEQIGDDCDELVSGGIFRRRARDECYQKVGLLRGWWIEHSSTQETIKDLEKRLEAALVTQATSASEPPAVVIAPPPSPARAAESLVVYANQNPLGSEWMECGHCLELYALDSRPGFWVLFIEDEPAPVAFGAGEFRRVPVDLYGNGVVVDFSGAQTKEVSTLYWEGQPRHRSPIRAVHYVLYGGRYVPSGWVTTMTVNTMPRTYRSRVHIEAGF